MKIKTTKVAKTIDSKDLKFRVITDLVDFPTLADLPEHCTDQPGAWCYLDDRDPARVQLVWSEGDPSVRHTVALTDAILESDLQALLTVIGQFKTRKDLWEANEVTGTWTGDADEEPVAIKSASAGK